MDVLTTRLAIVFLGCICLICIAGLVVSTVCGQESAALFGVLGGIAGNASGTIAGILVPTHAADRKTAA